MTAFMALAAAWGVLQLAVFGWFGGRSVRLGTLLAALAVGLYGCGVVALVLQLAYTRAVAAVTGRSLSTVVDVAGYTVDPFIEEVVKLAPLLLLGLLAVRVRRQWGLTDHVVLGAALGAGFGLLEAVLRFSHKPGGAAGVGGGWLIPSGLSATFIPGPQTTLLSWLPAPATSDFLSFATDAETYQHLVWSAVGGLGVGLLLRGRGVFRLLGVLPMLGVGGLHAASNYDLIVTGRSTLGDLAATPFLLVGHILGVLPLIALGVAAFFDRRDLARAADRLPAVFARGDSATLAKFAFLSPVWTAPIALRFTRVRRSLAYSAAAGPADDEFLGVLAKVRAQIGTASTPDAWRRVPPPGEVLRALRLKPRWPLVLLWLLLLVPVALFFFLGDFKLTSFVQDVLTSTVGSWLLIGLLAVGLTWLGWQLSVGVRALPQARRNPSGEVAARAQLRLISGVGALVGGAYALFLAITGTDLDRSPVQNFHVLDALAGAILAVLFVLGLAALITMFPPGGLGLALAGGGALGSGLAISAEGWAAIAGMGALSGWLLSTASGSGGGDGGSGDGSGDSGGDGGGEGRPQEPNFDNVEIDSRKITDYAMNPEHPVGGNKFRVINSRTGLGPEDAASVEQQIRTGVQDAEHIVGRADQFGQRWNADVPLTGPDGTITVRTAWIVDPGATVPRLVTISFP
ncbi:DUF6883 domain-containing protein [Hamadaea sp. NPDC051192]|uniref:DUF6883 domain-containing protein n=1 Tax=Hamadaea sp. NPDC051192 TaxID=3154940 RepID=UPI003447378A